MGGGFAHEKATSLYRKTYQNFALMETKLLGRDSEHIDTRQSYGLGIVVPDPITMKRI